MKLIEPFIVFSTLFAVARTGNAYSPAIILVPGAFHPAAVYDDVVSGLGQAGYRNISAVPLASFGTLATREEDIEYVIEVTKRYIDDGKDVILVGNSYGSTVIGEAVRSFPRYPKNSSTSTNSSSSNGRIIGLIFLNGYLPFITEVTDPATHLDIREVSPSWFSFSPNNTQVPETVGWDGDMENFPPYKTMYNALQIEEAVAWTKRLRSTSFVALNATATYVPYTGDFKVVYVSGNHDNAVPETLWRAYVNQPGAEFLLDRLDADHVPMLSRPKEVVDLIKKYAENLESWK